jgi:DNA polymerase III alpha subunit (gram-positive type)
MNYSIIDFETTGNDAKICHPLEVAVCRVTPGGREVFSRIFYHPDLTEIPEFITGLTGLSLQTCKNEGAFSKDIAREFLEFTKTSEYFIAHNRSFDMVVAATWLSKFPNLREEFPNHKVFNTDHWLCTIEDAEYPEHLKCRKLSHLALDYGYAFDPAQKIHRAETDINLVRHIMWKSGNSVDAMLARRNEPWVYLQALIPPPWEDGGAGKEAAKKAGYSFETARGTTEPKFPKAWIKRVKASQLEAEKKTESPFKRQVLR